MIAYIYIEVIMKEIEIFGIMQPFLCSKIRAYTADLSTVPMGLSARYESTAIYVYSTKNKKKRKIQNFNIRFTYYLCSARNPDELNQQLQAHLIFLYH